ncbi:MAG: PQQ-like beta-propeller repeat protein [Sedimentisphaerales bacterium]|nr:PQQ-like beta-propeller repeat protein [Sedimentisphaerales bacterium]
MKDFTIARIIPIVFAIVGVVLLYVWLSADAAIDLTERIPPMQQDGQASAREGDIIKIEGKLATFDGVPAEITGAWPRFRGPNFDAISTDETSLAKTWPDSGPQVLWSVEVGEGFAGAAIFAGRVYMLDYDREQQADVVRCLSLEDGKDIWRYAYPIKVKRWHGMSRTVPAVTEKYIVTIGPKCHVTCLDSMTGEFHWMYNLVQEFNTKVPQWYTAQCPLIEDGKAIIAPAGDDVLMMAVDCETGEIVWQTPNSDDWIMTHSSVVPMEFNGKRFYIYCGGDHVKGGVVGVSAVDGSVLWKTDEWKVRFSVPMPVVIGEDRLFVTAGYGQTESGCIMFRFSESNGIITAEPEFLHPTDVFGSIQQTPIFYEDYIYGVRPDGQLVCLDLGGNVVWTSTSANKFGSGPYTIVNGLFYLMDDSGVLTLAQAGSSEYKPLAQAKVLDGHGSWGPMAVASGCLIVRDTERMICLDISEQ